MSDEMSKKDDTELPQVPGDGPIHDDDAPETEPRGTRVMAVVRWAILAIALLAAGGTWWSFAFAQQGTSADSAKYQCPMHPQIVSDQPGECPICHMNLEPISADRMQKAPTAAPAATPSTGQAHNHPWDGGVEYICPMCPEFHEDKPGRCPKCGMNLEPYVHPPAASATDGGSAADGGQAYICTMCPEVHQDKPGRCPTCGMNLVPKPGEPAAAGADGQGKPGAQGQAGGAQPWSIPTGTVQVAVALDRVQAIGVRMATVQEKASTSSLRATAVVSAPEQNVAEVHVRASGFVEGISVRETGITVKAGQPLLSVYSPEVYQAQSELLATREWGLLPEGAAAAAPRGEGARRKLELLGVSQKVADKVLASGKPLRTIGISAPISGVITKKNVVLGSYVTPEMTLYEIVDLSKVYVVADIYQQNMPRVAVGTTARFTSSSRREVTAEAKVDLIYPQVSLEARTTRVRMQVQNSKLGLLPGEFGLVEFLGPSQTVLVIPRDALVDTGEQQYVFVEEQPGVFTPRVVRTAAEVGDSIEIAEGLKAGDRVVSGATFLLDSESRLQASLASVSAPTAPAAGMSCEAHFDQGKYPDKLQACLKCERAHAGMGGMVDDCKNAIPKPGR
jgi:Cu(I)/Ag(I) efflux system membrane fusion protein